MRIEFAKNFDKHLRNCPDKIKRAFQNRLILFIKDKYHPLLKNHRLSGEWRQYRSINITGDRRAIFREFFAGEVIFFAEIGTHSQLY